MYRIIAYYLVHLLLLHPIEAEASNVDRGTAAGGGKILTHHLALRVL